MLFPLDLFYEKRGTFYERSTFFFENLGFSSDISIATNMIEKPVNSLNVNISFVKITENITPNTASRLRISAAEEASVYFCPTF